MIWTILLVYGSAIKRKTTGYFGMKAIFSMFSSLVIYLLAPIGIASERSGDFAELLKRIEYVKDRNNIAGLGLVVVDAKKNLHQAYLGYADRENRVPVNKGTVFRVGSITKTFTSLAVLRLVEQDKLELADPVSKYIKKLPYQNTYKSSAAIQVAQLLEHTAGFQDMTQREFDFKHANWSLQQSFDYDPASRITAWQPGEYFSYTNSGAGITALLIEQISQQSFEEFVQKHIFHPLALVGATFFLEDKIRSRLAVGYDTDGETTIPYWHMLYRAFGAINLRVDDMAKFIRMLINLGKNDQGMSVFSATSIKRLEQAKTSFAARKGLRYGYGLGNYQWLHDGVLFHGHGGDADGYLAHYGYTRENNRGYFIVINAFNNTALRKIRRIIESWLVRDVEIIKPPPRYGLTDAEQGEIIGEYIALTHRFAWMDEARILKIFMHQGELYTQLGADAARLLIPVNKNQFRRSKQPLATILIAKNQMGATILQGDVGNFRKRVE